MTKRSDFFHLTGLLSAKVNHENHSNSHGYIFLSLPAAAKNRKYEEFPAAFQNEQESLAVLEALFALPFFRIRYRERLSKNHRVFRVRVQKSSQDRRVS